MATESKKRTAGLKFSYLSPTGDIQSGPVNALGFRIEREDTKETCDVLLSQFAPHIVSAAALHGLKQVASDCANSANKQPGVEKTLSDKWADGLARLEGLQGDDAKWSERADSVGFRVAEVVEAVARLKGKPLDEIKATWDTLPPDTRKGIAASDAVKKTIIIIRGEKAQAALAQAGDVGLDLF